MLILPSVSIQLPVHKVCTSALPVLYFNWSGGAGAFIFQYIEEQENLTESFIVSKRNKTVMKLWNITERWGDTH